MMALVETALTLAAALGAGLIAGTFFAFSSFVMPALSARTAPDSVAAMQSINVKVLNRSFLGTFFGTAVVSLALVVMALLEDGQAGAGPRLFGSGLYLIGTFGVTIACNVPRNNVLAAIDPTGPDAERAWASYDREWTAWNTVRTIAALVAGSAFIWSLT